MCVNSSPIVPEAYAIMGAVGEEVADAVNGQKDVEAALKACDKRVRRIMDDGGHYS